MSKCALCGATGKLQPEDFDTTLMDVKGHKIVVEALKVFHCTECENTWMSQLESDRISEEIRKRQRIPLQISEIEMIWQATEFQTKTAAASFLNLNSKAFTKVMTEKHELNSSTDLLLRLAVHSQANFNFIKHLREKNFRFDREDYELICDKFGGTWRFGQIEVQIDSAKYPSLSETVENSLYVSNSPTEQVSDFTGRESSGEAA